jgi:hypothetical protein
MVSAGDGMGGGGGGGGAVPAYYYYAPELLRGGVPSVEGDVYAFAIVMFEVWRAACVCASL